MTTTPRANPETGRILVVGRSPNVLLDTVAILRQRGFTADATNQFDRVLDDYDVTAVDVVVFGGMVPPDTKTRLRAEILDLNSAVTFVQGLAGIPGVIAAQTEASTAATDPPGGQVSYDEQNRTMTVTLAREAAVRIDAWWATSFAPPEPTSAELVVLDAVLSAGTHMIPLPDQIPGEAAFAAVRLGEGVRVLTVGPMPERVTRLVPTGSGPSPLPPVRGVTTHGASGTTDA